MAASTVMLPGDQVSKDALPDHQSSTRTLTLGPGLRFTPPSQLNATVAGSLVVGKKKHTVWIENNGRGRYIPTTGDLVIATVHHSSVDVYHCSITPYTTFATLPQLAFEGATRKTRPMLHFGSLVYARIAVASKHMDPELECVHPSSGKAEGLGELKGGMMFDASLGMARRLMGNKVAVLEDLGEKGLRFEIAVGSNGRVWVNSENTMTTLAIGKAIQETDEGKLSEADQSKLVKRLVKSV